jgi:phosphopantothenoylcysteine decarboxylase / phosphopantothenate---cysteine ligase
MTSDTSGTFRDKPIILGVSGGVAAYKSCEIASRLTQAGARVRVVMTRAATKLIRPLLFEAITGIPVVVDLFGKRRTSAMDHIWSASDALGAIVAPATANTIARLALGIADDALSTALLASNCPVVFAPAMNSNMWRQQPTQENVQRLLGRGWVQVGPDVGHLACGIDDIGRMVAPEKIVATLAELLAKAGSLAERKVLVTAGPTHEHLDDFRVLTNPSSGRMGYALAEEAGRLGASVTLVNGPSPLPPPPSVECIRVESAVEMQKAMDELYDQMDVVIMAAAVADFTSETRHAGKIAKEQAETTVTLKPTVDILEGLGKRKKGQLLVGFAAEAAGSDLRARGKAKLEGKNLDLIMVNPIGLEKSGFASHQNQGLLLWRDGEQTIPLMSKQALAAIILDRVVALLA